MASPRSLALIALAGWFAFWGYAAFTALQDRGRAEQFSVLAEARQDWGTAHVRRSEARSSAEAAALSIALGFGVPLLVLAIAEAKRVQDRRRGREEG